MALPINPWIMLILTFVAAVYLFVVLSMAFKEKTFVSSLTLLLVFIFVITYVFRPEYIGRFALSMNHITGGSSYTLITYMFLHASVPHIFLNALALLFFGYNVEREFAAPVMFMVFLTSGLVGGTVFLLTSSPSASVVGASGSIFGLMAYLTLIRPFKISPMPFLIPLPVSLAAAIYTVIAIPMFLNGEMGAVAHNAHIGGMIGGALMAFGMNKQQALKGLVVFVFLLLLVIVVPRILFI
ncbi:MAG: rhomboid family intramembrane serine protease [Candidatus Undinarchaeales archaeon]